MENLFYPVTTGGFMALTLEGRWELSRYTCVRAGGKPLGQGQVRPGRGGGKPGQQFLGVVWAWVGSHSSSLLTHT